MNFFFLGKKCDVVIRKWKKNAFNIKCMLFILTTIVNSESFLKNRIELVEITNLVILF